MQKLAHVVMAVGALALIACGGDSGGDSADARVISFTDAAGGGDGGSIQACNPVAQTGCEPNEKCANRVVQADPFLAVTECVPDGSIAAGGDCTLPETGADDCVAGTSCRNGLCKEICNQAPNSCTAGNCVLVSSLFQDLDGIGVCADKCHPVQQNCQGEEACYLNATLGEAACSRVPEETAGLVQDDPCYGPQAGSCYLNGCPKGFSPILNAGGPDGPGGSVCAAFCTPVLQHTGATDALQGDPNGVTCPSMGAVSHHCRFINTFYNNTQNVWDSVGFCVPPDLWGSCANHVMGTQVPEEFVPGCEPAGVADPAAQSKVPAGVSLPKFQGDLRDLQ